MRAPRRWWTIFAAGVLAVLAGVVWLSVDAIRSERAASRARAEADEQAAVRLALWRLDAWLGGFLAREAARTHSEYIAGAVGAPSPLRGFRSDYIQLHFLVDAEGALATPQEATPELGEALQRLIEGFENQPISHRVAVAEARWTEQLETSAWPPTGPEFSRRSAAGATCQLPGGLDFLLDSQKAGSGFALGNLLPDLLSGSGEAWVGPLVALWLGPGDGYFEDEFLFVRRVEWLGREIFQGFLGHWASLRPGLLSQISDLFPDADLLPILREEAGEAAVSRRLATLPVTLQIPARTHPAPRWTSTHGKLAVVWLAVAVAILSVGAALWSSIDFGARRQRFAAAVAHELRTPLTTFRMYTEMLADGSIREPDQRQEYLDILSEESRRLAGLVDNVLAYAGLEERPVAPVSEAVTVGSLLERVAPPLIRHTAESDVKLEIKTEVPIETILQVDVDLVSRLLFNLVDNACKYAASGAGAVVRLSVLMRDRYLLLRVRDQGPGISRAEGRKIFRPFERGARAPDGPRAGVGLGLALARGLARASGGDLTLEPSPDGGAWFELKLAVGGQEDQVNIGSA